MNPTDFLAGALRFHPRSRYSRRRALGTALALGGGLPVLASTARSRTAIAQEQATFTVAANWPPSDLDPQGGYDPGSGLILSGVFEGLIRQRSGDGKQFEPWLATSWEPNDDLSSWTFHLREGVTFQDGAPLTAEAVRASFERLFAIGLPPAKALGRFVESAQQIVAIDDRTVRFDLERPGRLFEAALAGILGTAIVNVAAALQHEVDGDLGRAWSQTNCAGLGTGPYRVTSFDPAAGAVLERFDGYWGGWSGAHFDRIVTRVVPEPETRRQLIEQGDADLIETPPLDAITDFERNPDLVVDRQIDLTVRYTAITQAAPFLQPEARQALCWAFPYQEVLQGVFQGYAKPAIGAVSERCAGFAPTTPTFSTDLAKAKALLDQAGVPSGTKLSSVGVVGGVIVQAISELYQLNLQQIGLELDIQQMEFAQYVGLAYGELPAEDRPNLFPSFWSPDYDDAWSQLWPLTSCNAWTSGNAGQYCNEQVDALLSTAEDATDEATYLDALAEAQKIVAYDDPAGIYFAQPDWITVLRSDIGGFVLNPVDSSHLDYYAMYRK